MTDHSDKLDVLSRLVAGLAPQEGWNETRIPDLQLYRESKPHVPKPRVYDPFIVFVVQGRKRVAIDEASYEYHAGMLLTTLAPVPVECQVIEASEEKPMLGMVLMLDRKRMLNMLMKMDLDQHPVLNEDELNPSSIFTAPLDDRLMDPAIRLLNALPCPAESTIVGEAAIDEIYFRILKHERGGALPQLLQQRGQIQQIARAVDYLHQNMEKVVSVDELAGLVNMSSSAFHKKFKEVMHLPPLQYAKRVKLNKAQVCILTGMSVSEAGYTVGYNSPAQFSREYKRYFGVSPSEAVA